MAFRTLFKRAAFGIFQSSKKYGDDSERRFPVDIRRGENISLDSFRPLLMHRQPYPERGTLAHFTFHFETSMVFLNNAI